MQGGFKVSGLGVEAVSQRKGSRRGLECILLLQFEATALQFRASIHGGP